MRGFNRLVLILLTVTLSGAVTITVETDPTGLDVWEGGDYLGVAPLTISTSPFKAEKITVTGKGYEIITKEVSTVFKSKTVTVEVPRTEVLVVITEPPGLKVLIDGKYVGDGPVSLDGPFYRDFEITVTGEGYEEVTEKITIGWEGYEKKIVIAPDKKE